MEDKQLEEALAASIEKSFNDSELEDIMNEIENLEREFTEDSSAPKVGNNLSLEKARDNDLQRVIDEEVASINSEISAVAVVEAEAETEIEEEAFDAEDFESMADTEEDMQISASEMADETVEAVAQADDDMNDVEEAEMFAMEETIAKDHSETENNVFAISTPAITRRAQMNNQPTTNSAVEFNAAGAMDLNINFSIGGQAATLKIVNGALCVSLNGVDLTIDETNGCCVKMAGGVQFTVPLATSAAKKNAA